jgi:3-oxosteroid 1-dehydrogenase
LAQRIGVDAEGLGRTVGEHNQFALTGVDLAFGKGSSALNRHNGDAAVKPNPCLRPIGSGPLFAVRVEPTPIGTAIGLRTDADARVLDAAGAPITGLYATGSDMSSIMRGHYPGPGITLGPSLIFAYRAARQMRLAANAPVGVSM